MIYLLTGKKYIYNIQTSKVQICNQANINNNKKINSKTKKMSEREKKSPYSNSSIPIAIN